jgi:SOS-response transcriptional repressor LexA
MTGVREPLPLTERQRDCFEAIKRLITELGRSPTHSELAAAIGVKSKGRVNALLSALRERGFIDWMAGRACSITIVERGGVYPLPPDVQRRLEGYCAKSGERPLAVIADAVVLMLDYAEQHVDEIRGGGHSSAPSFLES